MAETMSTLTQLRSFRVSTLASQRANTSVSSKGARECTFAIFSINGTMPANCWLSDDITIFELDGAQSAVRLP